MFYILLACFGCLSGVTALLFGFGGGFVVVPLIYSLLTARHVADAIGESAMHIAVATSTCVMIFNASVATRKHHRAGQLLRQYVWPFGGFIALGAILGAAAAHAITDEIIRYAFIAYLGLTILDCLLRRGFLTRISEIAPRPLSVMETAFGGSAVGIIATFLGVGGSVMTVPLLRRCGLSMSQATAMANPLSMPVALAGTVTYMMLASFTDRRFGWWFIGYIDLLAFAVLTLGALLGIRLATPWIGRIPDRLHARVYVGLLIVVMGGMLVG